MIGDRISKIVVVGAGFAGLRAVKRLANTQAEILLIDRHNYHTFVPLLYQVATGYIEPELIAYPLRKALRQLDNVKFLMAEVEKIDFDNRTVITNSQNISYDYLAIATGSQANFLEVSGAPKHSFPLRTLEDAVALRNHIFDCLEKANQNLDDICLQRQLMTFTIVGGGPTGVEMAGALHELINDCLTRDYPQLDLQETRVILLQSRSSLLNSYPEKLQQYTSRQLRNRGIKIHFNNRVKSVTPSEVILEDETSIATATVIWTAGVEANLPKPEEKFPTASKNKIKVSTTLQLQNYPEVYAVGDVAYVRQDGEPLMGIAPEALQQGGAIAKNIQLQLRGKSPQAFAYFNKGTAAIIARNTGVAYLLGKIPISGFWAWLLWLGIHVYYLPGLSNRGKILGAWCKDYFFHDRSTKQIFQFYGSNSIDEAK